MMPWWVVPVASLWWIANGVYAAIVQQHTVGWFFAGFGVIILVGHQLIQESERR